MIFSACSPVCAIRSASSSISVASIFHISASLPCFCERYIQHFHCSTCSRFDRIGVTALISQFYQMCIRDRSSTMVRFWFFNAAAILSAKFWLPLWIGSSALEKSWLILLFVLISSCRFRCSDMPIAVSYTHLYFFINSRVRVNALLMVASVAFTVPFL